MSPAKTTLWVRDIANDLQSAPSTFSNWDKCMAKSYCKWPVIVGIIVGSVILLAVIACIVNCLCCGYQCCKCCCSCCCPSGRRRNKTPKHYDAPPLHKAPSPLPKPTYQAPPAPPSYRGAEQTARFDVSKPTPTPRLKSPGVQANEDALPQMPTWADAKEKHVENENYHEDVEMEPLNPLDRKQGAGTPGAAYSDYTPNSSLGGYRGFTPTDPYAHRSLGPGVALDPVQDSYARRSPGTPSPGGIDPYGRRSPGPAAALVAAPDPFARRSPGLAAGLAATQDPYGRHSPGIVPPAAAIDPYARRRSPGPGAAYSTPDPYAAHSPGPTSPIMSSPQNPYDQSYSGGYDNHYGAGAGYHATTSSPGGEHNPHMQYGGMPMAISTDDPTPGFQRQSFFGTTPYPVTPTYPPQPAPYRSYSPGGATPSSPPPFAASATEYSAYNPHAASAAPAAPQPEYTRPPSLLQSGKKSQPNASSNF